MSLTEFIRRHRAELDERIIRAAPNIRLLSDQERRLWVLNDEDLYLWARREGVRI